METWTPETKITSSDSEEFVDRPEWNVEVLYEKYMNGQELTEEEYAWLNRRLGGAYEHPDV